MVQVREAFALLALSNASAMMFYTEPRAPNSLNNFSLRNRGAPRYDDSPDWILPSLRPRAQH